MDRELQRLKAITGARDRLRRVAFAEGTQRRPALIAFSQDWLHKFASLKDAELVCPVSDRATGVRFWGIPVELRESGDVAVVKYADASSTSVPLELL